MNKLLNKLTDLEKYKDEALLFVRLGISKWLIKPLESIQTAENPI